MDLNAHWNMLRKMQPPIFNFTRFWWGSQPPPRFWRASGRAPAAPPPSPDGDSPDLRWDLWPPWPCYENVQFCFMNIFWTKEGKAIIQMPSCFCRSNALKHVFVDPERSRSKFYLTSRHIKVKSWPKANLQINRCGLTRWTQYNLLHRSISFM